MKILKQIHMAFDPATKKIRVSVLTEPGELVKSEHTNTEHLSWGVAGDYVKGVIRDCGRP